MFDSHISAAPSIAAKVHGEPSLAALLRDDTSAAVAAMYALVMFMLVGIVGVAWDWTRMTALDSELQNAADQAALAAATQLDGRADAISRASAAASGLVANTTVMGNDGSGTAVAIPATGGLVFYDGYDQATDAFGTVTTTDAAARVVTVSITPRAAVYTMTPIVGILRSGNIIAKATASLGSAICNTPPVMMCNPMEEDNKEFNPNNYVGYGMRLITDGTDGAPGNFGFLANGLGTGTAELAKSLGWDYVPANCQPTTGVTTEPGLKDVVFDAINTRFDIDTNGANTCPGGSSNCTAAPVSRKDLVKKDLAETTKCGIKNNEWEQAAPGSRYVPPSARVLTAAERANVKVMGYPRDLCHAHSVDGNCTTDKYSVIGTKDWDRDAFFQANYGWDNATWKSQTGFGDNVTRFQVYEWETARYLAGTMTSAQIRQTVGSTTASTAPVCRSQGDASRRKITAAVINCTAEGVRGRKVNVKVKYWAELFLVEPSMTRKKAGPSSDDLTDKNDVYVEVIRAIDIGGDGATGDVVRRDVPYLIR